MATMSFEIPDGMTAQVLIAPSDGISRREPLQITDQRMGADPHTKRRLRPFLLATLGLAILAVGFTVGTHTRTSHWAAQAETAPLGPASSPGPAPAATALAAPPPATVGFPAQAIALPPGGTATLAPPPAVLPATAPAAAGPQAGTNGQMPPNLAAALAVTPQVTPAPGQPGNQPPSQAGTSAQPPANAFGLGD